MALAGNDAPRGLFPALERKFTALHPYQQAEVVRLRPSGYFAGFLAGILQAAQAWRTAEEFFQTAVLPCAPFITSEQLPGLLEAWAENPQCRAASLMPGAAAGLWAAAPQVQASPAWSAFVSRTRELEPDSDYYQYEVLADAIGYGKRPDVAT